MIRHKKLAFLGLGQAFVQAPIKHLLAFGFKQEVNPSLVWVYETLHSNPNLHTACLLCVQYTLLRNLFKLSKTDAEGLRVQYNCMFLSPGRSKASGTPISDELGMLWEIGVLFFCCFLLLK